MRRTAAPILAVVALLTAACAHRPTAGEADGTGPEQRQREFLAALAARDVEQTTAHFAEDAVLHVANMPPIQGREAIGQFYGRVFRFLSASEAKTESTRIAAGSDMAFTVGSVTNVFEREQGRVEYTGKFLLVWEKRQGTWWIAVYSVSNNQSDAAR